MTGQALRPGVVVGGAALGFVLSRTGFTSWDEVHAMFTFSDLRLVGVFAVAVFVVAIGLRVLRQAKRLPTKMFHKSFHSGLVPGAVLFGLGWAFSGACPGASLAMVGEGQAAAVVGLTGVLIGTALAQAGRHTQR